MSHLLDHSGVVALIAAELAGRPGPRGLPIRTVLLGLLLSIHYIGKATLCDAWRLVTFSLTPAAQDRLSLKPINPDDPYERLASSRRFYRAFDRITSTLDPARTDRRTRLPRHKAIQHAVAWEDDDPEHRRLRDLLQTIVTNLILAPVVQDKGRRYFKYYQGHVGIDATAMPTWAKPPRANRGLASTEITAGWHHSAGNDRPTFGYSATLATATRTRTTLGTYPQLVLGLVIDTPHKRIGQNAITTLHGFAPLGLPVGALAVDRAYTDQATEHFARPARALGYHLVLDYKQDQRGLQGSAHGALLIDGNLACPLMPTPLIHATKGLDDKTVRTPPEQLNELIAAREPYWLKLKQSADAQGRIRLQCPAAGPSPSVTCPRLNRTRPTPPASPAAVDLTNARQRDAHLAAKPTIQLPDNERKRLLPLAELPRICQKSTITLRPDDLGIKDKLRQDRRYLTPTWQDAYRSIRANTEGVNGRIKGHHIDIGDPMNRLAHGRVAQTLLTALMVCLANQHILLSWRQTHDRTEQPAPQDTPTPDEHDPAPPKADSRPPPRE
ncbi:hypothetical protein [Streptosporangium canum]|nr:hypothetical protein [Streptosporangium canum]